MYSVSALTEYINALGRTPDHPLTWIEELIARLSQHGVQRIHPIEEDARERGALHGDNCLEDTNGGAPGLEQHESRERYCYYCLCCDKELTPWSTAPPTSAMLQDIHYHCATARHRRAVSWRDDSDALATLQRNPQLENPDHFIQVHVNGYPVLLSRHPGGGEMFYPLPHETHLVSTLQSDPNVPSRDAEYPALHGGVSQGFKPPLWPSDAKQAYWYYPMQSLSCHSYQHVSLDCRYEHQYNAISKDMLKVEHIPWEEYHRESFLHGPQFPRHSIACMALKRTHSSKGARFQQHLYARDKAAYPTTGEAACEEDLSRYLVTDRELFRIIVTVDKSGADEGVGEGGIVSHTLTEDATRSTPVLTVELLQRLFPSVKRPRGSGSSCSNSHFSLSNERGSRSDNLNPDEPSSRPFKRERTEE